ncbi:MAG: hypothetical protein E7474_13510 [Ruminococcaceae bacterium]|nr:hypothetical protein [Oscillospiraceae bacterium]
MARKKDKGRKEKKEKRSRRERRKERTKRFAYDHAVSMLGGAVCTFAIISLGAIILLIVYAALFMT